MEAMNRLLRETKEFQNLKLAQDQENYPIQVNGCVDGQICQLMHLAGEQKKYRLIITYSEDRAKELYEDYRFFDKEVYLYPAKDVLFYSADVHGSAIVGQRLEIMKRILEEKPATIITTIDGGFDRLLPLHVLERYPITIQTEEVVELKKFSEQLTELGYEYVSMVEHVGQYARRGGILDIFPIGEECPYRVELWGDEIDTIRSFDVDSQRSMENLEKLTIYPACEYVLDDHQISDGLEKMKQEYEDRRKELKEQMLTSEYSRLKLTMEREIEEIEVFRTSNGIDGLLPYFYPNNVNFFSYFDKDNSIFYFDEPSRTMDAGKAFEKEYHASMEERYEGGYILPAQMQGLFELEDLMQEIFAKQVVFFSNVGYIDENTSPKTICNFHCQGAAPYNNHFEYLIKDLTKWKKDGYRVLLLSPSRTRALRLADNIQLNEVPAFFVEADSERVIEPGEIMVAAGRLRKGFLYPDEKFVVVSEGDIFQVKQQRKSTKTKYQGEVIRSFQDIVPGDYVVHESHGVGIYKGIEKIEVDGVGKDYISIEYANKSNLFILASQLDKMQKYASNEARKPKLNKLGGQEWTKTVNRVNKQVGALAKELVELYAIRQKEQGFACDEDTVWQKEFEELFPYEETQDQKRAIEETKEDMESTKIMDRLICGDVGYGKTEIAIRAAFKAVSNSKQVVYLVPTTILAQQHYHSFTQRMKDFPITIRMLSRFASAKEQKETLQMLKNGQADIVIGTHRVFSKDVEYKNLGLLIIDEEQRFGVAHKEKIKQMKKNVDVLTLTATPIPRTLRMSLSGIRDMSLLEEPPVDRRAIQTYVLEYNEEIIKEAIKRELARGGQVYYVYNRVNNIEEIADTISRLVPNAKVGVGHGKMSERQLEVVMQDFVDGELDVLVATTIIETGLDIPNVNTMIIHDADRFGLSQLYQLRGRVGRSNKRAYAFLMYKRDRMIQETAQKRLAAIKEYTDLGSGFKIAMRDLEIRGAGNVLGEDQSGHMAAVGYDMYCKMLNDAVKEMKGEPVEKIRDVYIDLNIDAFIPVSYVKNEVQKLDLYQRIAFISSQEQYEDMIDELIDRYGDLPLAVKNLLHIAFMKNAARDSFVDSIEQKQENLVFVMDKEAPVNVSNIDDFLKTYRGRMKFSVNGSPTFTYQLRDTKKNQLIEVVETILKQINELLEN